MSQETDGIVQVGEVPVIIRRDSPSEVDFSQTERSAREGALKEMLAFVEETERTSPPYTDIRPYAIMRTWVLDRIQETVNGAT